MRIRRADIAGYGRLTKRVHEFGDGLNCVFGPNEAGKSTLLSFLTSMLYGHARAGVTRRLLEPVNAACAPWSGARYGGEIVVSLSSGSEFVVRRDFADGAETMEIVDKRTGKDVTRDHERSASREYCFVEAHARIDKGAFEHLFVVQHDSIDTLAAKDDAGVADRLEALADTGAEKGGAQKAAGLLTKEREAIGTERARTRPFAVTLERLARAREAYARAKEAYVKYAADLALRRDLTAEVEAAKARLRDSRALIQHSIAAVLAQLDEERDGLTKRLKALAPAEALPASVTEAGLTRTDEALSAARKALAAAANAEEDARKQFSDAEAALAGLGPFARCSEADLRAAADAVEGFVDARRAVAERLHQLEEVESKVDAVESRWGGEGDLLAAVTAEEAEMVAGAPMQDAAATGQSIQAATAVKDARALVSRRKVGAIARASCAAAFIVSAALILLKTESGMSLLAAGALALLAAMLAVGATRASRAIKAAKDDVERRCAGLAEIERRATQSQARVAAVIGRFPGRTREWLVGALRDYAADRNTVALYDAEAKRFDAAVGEEKANVETARGKMLASLAAVGIAAGPSLVQSLRQFGTNVPAAGGEVDVFSDVARASAVKEAFGPLWQRSRAAQDARARIDACRSQVDRAVAGGAKSKAEAADAARSMSELLAAAGVETVDALRARVSERSEVADTRNRVSALASRERVLLNGASRGEFLREFGSSGAAPAVPLVPEDGIPAARAEMNRIRQDCTEKEQSLSTLSARLEEGLKNFDDLATLEDRVKELEERHALQVFHRDAVDEALRIVTGAASAFHETVFPKIETALAGLLSDITAGAHDAVALAADGDGAARRLTISVSDKGKTTPVDPSTLSQGTLEQVYLAARLALIEALSTDETLPIFLDDPFINYDSSRLSAAIGLLAKTAPRHQVFLFTCQSDVRDLCAGSSARIITL